MPEFLDFIQNNSKNMCTQYTTHASQGGLNYYDVPGQLRDVLRNLRCQKLHTFTSQEPSTTEAADNRVACVCRDIREIVNLLARALPLYSCCELPTVSL